MFGCRDKFLREESGVIGGSSGLWGGTLTFEISANSVLVVYILCCWMKAVVLGVLGHSSLLFSLYYV